MEKTKIAFQKGYKFRFYPDIQHVDLFNKTFGCCRYVWNRCLSEAKAEYDYYLLHNKQEGFGKLIKPNTSGFNFTNKLPSYKIDTTCSWLNEVSAVALQQSTLNLGKAFSTFFKNKKGYPKFKKKDGKQSFTLTGTSFDLDGKDCFIAKSRGTKLNIDWHRDLPSYPSSCTISRTPTGKYYISFVCEYMPTPTTGTGKMGIDLGLSYFLTTSDGIKIDNQRHTKHYAKILKRRQQSLARKMKGSNNRKKAKLKVALIHEKISNCRSDFHHKLSRKLVNENQVIGIETLKVANMVKNRKLSKAISDVGWSQFIQMLLYKARESQHTTVVMMGQWYASSHICNVDNEKLDRKLSLSERSWVCPVCGTLHDRDINAAKNIRDIAVEKVATFIGDLPRTMQLS